MKTLSKLALSGLLLLTAHSVSFAGTTTTLHLTGAQAFRSSLTNAIVNYLSANYGTVTGAYVGSSLGGASNQVFEATNSSNGNTLIVETDYTGAVQGIYDTSHGNLLSNAWLNPTSNTLSTITPATAPATVSGGTKLSSPVYGAAVAPDVNASDVWQASTLFPTPAETEVVSGGVGVEAYVVLASKAGTSGTQPGGFQANAIPVTLTAGSNTVSAAAYIIDALKVGYVVAPSPAVSGQPNVPPFAVVTSVNTSANTFTLSVPAAGSGTATVGVSFSYPGWTNVTAEQLAGLYTNGTGTLPLSEFTGAPADATGYVLATGRSPDSGTRVEFTEEIGIHNETSGSQIYQLVPYDSNGNLITNSTTQIANIAAEPATTFNGVTLAAGDNGYTSGGQVAAVLGNPTLFNALTNYFFVSPLGVSDAKTAIGLGATALTFNGESYNQIYVEQGKYPLWSYEHLYQAGSLSGTVLTAAQGIANQLATSDAIIDGDLISNLSVYRSPITVDGAPIFNDAPAPGL